MNIRYKVRKEVPYNQEVCSREVKFESKEEHEDFIKFFDKSLIGDFEKYNQRRPDAEEEINLINNEKDLKGDRHWGASYEKRDIIVLKDHWEKVEKLENDVIQYSQI